MKIKLKNKKEWHRFYCFVPRVIEGRLVWLDCAYKKFDEKLAGPESSNPFGEWVYKL